MLKRICRKISSTKKKKKYKSSETDFINPLFINKLTKNKNCSICWKDTNEDIEIIFPFDCSHFICYPCFKKWIEVARKNNRPINCPLCRKNILTKLYYKKNLKKYILTLNKNKIIIWY